MARVINAEMAFIQAQWGERRRESLQDLVTMKVS